MPSSWGPTLAPLPPSWWQTAQCFSKTWPPGRVGLGSVESVAAVGVKGGQLLVGGRQALEQCGDSLGDARQARALQDDGDGSFLEQARRRLAGRDGLRAARRLPRAGAPGPRRSPTGAARAQSAGCSEGPSLPRDGRGCPAGSPPSHAWRSEPKHRRARPRPCARFAFGSIDRQGSHGVHPGLLRQGHGARSPSSDCRLHVAEPEVADDVDTQRDLARLPTIPELGRPSVPPVGATVRRAPAPRSWAPCWTAFKSLSRSAGAPLLRNRQRDQLRPSKSGAP